MLLAASHPLAASNPLAASASPFTLQTVVESESPRDPDLTLADEPLVRIGMLDGPMDYIFGNVTGAIRLEDGSVVIADEQSYNLRRFDVSGQHMWTSGRHGEGPGEYGGLRLLRGCPGATITVFDWNLDRITELDQDGNVTDTRALNVDGVNPYNEPACTPDGDLVFTPWPETDLTVAAGEHHRWQMELSWARGGDQVTLRSGIPGTERTRYANSDGPRTWGRTMVFAVAPTGARRPPALRKGKVAGHQGRAAGAVSCVRSSPDATGREHVDYDLRLAVTGPGTAPPRRGRGVDSARHHARRFDRL